MRPLQEHVGKRVITESFGAPGKIVGLCDAQGQPVGEDMATDYMVRLDQPLSGIFAGVSEGSIVEHQAGFAGDVMLPASFVMVDPGDMRFEVPVEETGEQEVEDMEFLDEEIEEEEIPARLAA